MIDARFPYALPAGSSIAGFEIVRVLGAGGFGITYEGYNDVTRRRVAIKEFYPQGTASREGATKVVFRSDAGDVVAWALSKFRSSTTELAQIDHPHVVEVLHYVKDNNTGYMVMAHVDGASVTQLMRERSEPLSTKEMRALMTPVCDAMDYVHERGIIHRDIAPDNIMIRKDGRPILIDFGALKVIEDRTTARSHMSKSFSVTKRYFSAPELYDSESQPDVRADVYSLAAVTYFAITGKPPASSDDRMREIAFRKPDPYVPLRQMARVELPQQMCEAIDCALNLKPEDRLDTVHELMGFLSEGDEWTEAAALRRAAWGPGGTIPVRGGTARSDPLPRSLPPSPSIDRAPQGLFAAFNEPPPQPQMQPDASATAVAGLRNANERPQPPSRDSLNVAERAPRQPEMPRRPPPLPVPPQVQRNATPGRAKYVFGVLAVIAAIAVLLVVAANAGPVQFTGTLVLVTAGIPLALSAAWRWRYLFLLVTLGGAAAMAVLLWDEIHFLGAMAVTLLAGFLTVRGPTESRQNVIAIFGSIALAALLIGLASHRFWGGQAEAPLLIGGGVFIVAMFFVLGGAARWRYFFGLLTLVAAGSGLISFENRFAPGIVAGAAVAMIALFLFFYVPRKRTPEKRRVWPVLLAIALIIMTAIVILAALNREAAMELIRRLADGF